MESSNSLPYEILKKIEPWRHPPFAPSCKEEIDFLLTSSPQKLIDAFYTTISFGTAGLRGIMGIGTNRINCYTIGQASEALARTLKKAYPNQQIRVAITFDSRHHSKEFAAITARVLAYHHIDVYISKELRPTPFLSFTCRNKQCHAAVMITASHNPKEFNGYKVYWSDGAQVVAPYDKKIMQEMEKVSCSDVVMASESSSFIHYLTEEDDYLYIKALMQLANHPSENHENGDKLYILYSSMHGTASTLLPKAFKGYGFTHFEPVRKQEAPDGDFPYAKNPNPESKEALELGLELLSNVKADILLALDPDADRVGCAIRHHEKTVIFSGNEIASLCLYHLLETYKKQKKLSKAHVVISTIVTTRLLKKMSLSYGVFYIDTLTGFKYIGEKIKELEGSKEKKEFLFGAEESYGYLHGTYARDKDGILISCLLSEMALYWKLKEKTLLDALFEIYKKWGVFQEKQLSISLPEGKESQDLIEKSMHLLRQEPPLAIGSSKVCTIVDYLKSIDLPKSNVLSFTCEDESVYLIRPSGTEPKIKIYGMIRKSGGEDIAKTIEECQEELSSTLAFIKKDVLKL